MKHNLILSLPRSKSCFSLLVLAYFLVGLCKELGYISTPYLNTSIGRIISRFGSNCHRNALSKMRVFYWNENVPFIFLSEPVCIERTNSSSCSLKLCLNFSLCWCILDTKNNSKKEKVNCRKRILVTWLQSTPPNRRYDSKKIETNSYYQTH